MGSDIRVDIKRELKSAKFFDSYFSAKDLDAGISAIRPYSPRTAQQRAAGKLANHLDGLLVKLPRPNGGVSVVRFLYALVELKFKRVFRMMESEREHYDVLLDDFIREVLGFDQYPYILFTQTEVKW